MVSTSDSDSGDIGSIPIERFTDNVESSTLLSLNLCTEIHLFALDLSSQQWPVCFRACEETCRSFDGNL